MIVSSPFDKDLLGHEIRGVNTSYYGLSALQAVINHDGIRQDIAKYMYRDCIVDGGRKGVIIGFEDNNQFFDNPKSGNCRRCNFIQVYERVGH